MIRNQAHLSPLAAAFGAVAILSLTLAMAGTRPAPETAEAPEADAPESLPVAGSPEPAFPAPGGSGSPTALASTDQDWWSAAVAEIERSEYQVSATSHGLQAPNRAQNLRTFFREGAIEVRLRTNADEEAPWQFGWRTASWGRADDMTAVAATVPQANGSRVTYAGVGISEWYENREEGLEQGFTVHESVPGEGPLRIEGRVDGAARAELRSDGSVDFFDTNGVRILNYGKLVVWDADGTELSSWLDVAGDVVAIAVDDEGARYPLTVDPLLTNPSWTVLGGQDGAHFGARLATAGDVNGDGYSDVLVGAYGYDGGSTNEGRAYVFLGSASGVAFAPAWTYESNVAGVILGIGVAPAGDVNGDGYDDVVVGASRYAGFAGRAYVFHGSVSGLGASPAWTYDSGQPDAHLGFDVAGAGDVNADGYDDVVIGALAYDSGSGDEGRALVFHGSPGGLDTAPAWVVDGDDPGGQFGTSVSTAGDVNGDGYDDVIVGSYVHDNGQTDEGRAAVYLGGSAGLATSAAWTAEGNEANAWFGYSVSTAGDVNGDGYADVLVGAPHKDGGSVVDSGEAYLYYGSPLGPASTPAWTGGTSRVEAEYGWSVATAGDVNGDGFADFAVGAPQWYSAFGMTEGLVLLFQGSSSGPQGGGLLLGTQHLARFGHCVATAGDVNGDGFSDLLVGSQLYDGSFSNEGQADLYLGEAAGPSPVSDWNAQGSGPLELFGYSSASAGDVDGDGYSDLIVGALGFDDGSGPAGKAFVYSGSPSGLGALASWSATSSQPASSFGFSVASAGDVNGDGYSDVIVGAYTYTGTSALEGAAMVYLGSSSGLEDSPAWVGVGGQADSRFGYSVASAGDVNGDGYSDVIVGAFGFDNGQTDEGRAHVYLGSGTGLLPAPSWVVESDQPGALFGVSVASAGDVNGDGFSDVIVGALSYDLGQVDEGAAFVYHGSPAGPAPAPNWVGQCDVTEANFGMSVASAGDVNGDGYSDVIVGAGYYSNPEDTEGAAFLYLGSSGGVSSSASWTVESDLPQTLFGSAVGSAGDVNGDGFSDVVVGARWYGSGSISGVGRVELYLGSSSSLSTSAVWSVTGQSSQDNLGTAVGCAGDVNGDGFSDVVVGAGRLSATYDRDGAAYVFLGNTGGRTRLPRQERTDGMTPIALLGRSDAPDAFRMSAHAASPAGRSRVRLEVEVKPAGAPFDGAGTTITAPTDAGVAGTTLAQLVPGLQADDLYRWRARILDDSPLFPPSRWMSVPGNGITEADLRTGTASTAAPLVATAAPQRIHFAPPRPNPSVDVTALRFTLPAPGNARLAIYDLAGRRVALVADGPHAAGPHSFRWDGTNMAGRRVASGTYFARLSFGNRTETRKIVRVR